MWYRQHLVYNNGPTNIYSIVLRCWSPTGLQQRKWSCVVISIFLRIRATMKPWIAKFCWHSEHASFCNAAMCNQSLIRRHLKWMTMSQCRRTFYLFAENRFIDVWISSLVPALTKWLQQISLKTRRKFLKEKNKIKCVRVSLTQIQTEIGTDNFVALPAEFQSIRTYELIQELNQVTNVTRLLADAFMFMGNIWNQN